MALIRRCLHSWPFLALIAQVWLSWRALRSYARWPVLPRTDATPLPACVSVIVPARDEAANLRRLLPDLVALDPAPGEILVIDDRSGDETAKVAGRYPVRLVAGTEPPVGWTGKTWACHQGRGLASGEWLLFVDADTAHQPGSLGAALRTAQALGADVLSLFPEQECRGFWERLLLPFAFSHYFACTSAAVANDDTSPRALANGQYILVRATAYDRAGGHAAVRASLLEDVSLARVLRSSGARIRVLRANSQVSVRMYDGLPRLWEGFRKNSYSLLRSDWRLGLQMALATTLAGLPLSLAWRAARGQQSAGLALLSYLSVALAYAPWLRWYGVPLRYAALQPLAYGTFQVIAADSALRGLFGIPLAWKGRDYRVVPDA